MAKSKKYLKKKAKSKGKRKIHNTRKKVRHDKNYIHINNTGSTNVMYTQGNRPPKKTTFKWDGKYDGKNANIHMDLNVNGKNTKSNIKLSNKDLMKILSANVVDKPINQRLESFDEDVSNIYSSSSSMPSSMPMSMSSSMPMSSHPILILEQEPQMIMASSSNVPVFVNEMPMPMSSPPKKLKKGRKSKANTF
jgi:hypothetical protein